VLARIMSSPDIMPKRMAATRTTPVPAHTPAAAPPPPSGRAPPPPPTPATESAAAPTPPPPPSAHAPIGSADASFFWRKSVDDDI
jgi:hypothetical protein